MLDHIGHATEGRGTIGAAGTQELDDLGFAPAGQAGGLVAQVLRIPAFQHRAGQELAAAIVGHRLFLEGQPARGMAGAAVGEAFNQFGAALLAGIQGWIRGEAARAREQQLPPGKRPAHVGRPWNGAVGVVLPDRLHCAHEVGIQRLDLGVAGDHVRGVGHCRIQRLAVMADATPHRALEIRIVVRADAGIRVRGDVGRIQRAHRRLHAKPTGEGLAARCGMAGGAVGGT
ncbi:hypothetical protein D3C72_1376240 [compost metagenome]